MCCQIFLEIIDWKLIVQTTFIYLFFTCHNRLTKIKTEHLKKIKLSKDKKIILRYRYTSFSHNLRPQIFDTVLKRQFQLPKIRMKFFIFWANSYNDCSQAFTLKNQNCSHKKLEKILLWMNIKCVKYNGKTNNNDNKASKLLLVAFGISLVNKRRGNYSVQTKSQAYFCSVPLEKWCTQWVYT